MKLEKAGGLPGQEKARERRRETLERERSFANYFDRVSEEVRDEIEQLSRDIATEVTDQNNELGRWFGDVKFKLRLQKMLKHYLSGFDRDQEALMSDNLSDPGDREVAEQVFLEADKHLSKFSDLGFDDVEPDSDELDNEDELDDGEDDTAAPLAEAQSTDENENMAGEELVREKEGVWRRHAKEGGSDERHRYGERSQEELDRLNEQLQAIIEEVKTWNIDTPEQYEEVVQLLMREHDLKLNDAIQCLRGNTNLPRWTEGKLIRELMDGKQAREKDRGFSQGK